MSHRPIGASVPSDSWRTLKNIRKIIQYLFLTSSMRHLNLICSAVYSDPTPWNPCYVMPVDSRSGVYIFSRSRGDNRAAEWLLLRIKARRDPFGLGRSSQRWTNTVLAVYLLIRSSYSPHTLHIDRKSLCSLLIGPKASQRSQPLTRIISAAQ